MVVSIHIQRRANSLSSKALWLVSYILHFPFSYEAHLEKFQRNFLGRGLQEDFKYHRVNWKVCLAREVRVSVFHNLGLIKAFLGKWLWRC